EMVHVWQHQWGRSVMGQGLLLAVKGGYGPGAHAYDYDPDQDQGKTFSAFNMEQQGDLIAHYFDARYLCNSTAGKRPQRVAMLPFYEAVLADVLRNPADARCLPRSTRVWR
ncbi:MAG TPA: PAAR domain-containing protein, partial [Aquabacterium sp.]|nr:PAAR domain-containing protein [Aquabacterium sp.]